PMAIAALEQLLAWGVDNTAETLGAVTAGIAQRAAALGLGSSRRRAGHFIGLRFPGGPPDNLPERLAAARVHVSLRGPALRVTPHLYNRPEEIERLFAVLAPLL